MPSSGARAVPVNKEKATLLGLSAVIQWSTVVGFTRAVSEGLGPIGGGAVIYTLGTILLILLLGFPRIKTFSRQYLGWGSFLFCVYTICQCCSIGWAHTSRQVIEISMINYLWPSFTILFAIIFNIQKATLVLIPGLCLTLVGVALVIGGDDGFNVNAMLANIKDNPLSYSLALLGALLWPAYCVVTSKTANGQNGVGFFFLVTAITLWIMFLAGDWEPLRFDLKVASYALLLAMVSGFGYAAWNVGILYGNITLLATASYFIPVFSSVFSSILLGVPLSFSFWQGAILVCSGSMLCWVSTRKRI